MDRDKLLTFFEDHYVSRQEMSAMIPLGTRPDTLWTELLDRRKEKGRKLPLSAGSGKPFWYVITPRMVTASEQIMEELFHEGNAIDPYVETLPVSTLEEAFYTGYVDGVQLAASEAMQFLMEGLNPTTMEQQLLLNNRNAISFTIMNLYRKLDHNFLYMLYQILTNAMDGCNMEFRPVDFVDAQYLQVQGVMYPAANTIKTHFDEFCVFLSDRDIHPLIKAGVAQVWAFAIMPFPDGNERLGRLISQTILLRSGYTFLRKVSLSSLIARTSYAYYTSITNSLLPENDGDLTYFLEYFLELLAQAVNEKRYREENPPEEETRDRMLDAPDEAYTSLPDTTTSSAVLPDVPTSSVASQEIPQLYDEAQFPNIPHPADVVQATDPTTLSNIIAQANTSDAVTKLEFLQNFSKADTLHGYAARFILSCIQQNKREISVSDLHNISEIAPRQRSVSLKWLKNQGIFSKIQLNGKTTIYTLSPDLVDEKVGEQPPFGGQDDPDELLKSKINDLLSKDNAPNLKKLLQILHSFLQVGKTTFISPDIPEDLSFTKRQITNAISCLRMQGIITVGSKKGYCKEYTISPVLIECFQEIQKGKRSPKAMLQYLKSTARKAYTNQSMIAHMILSHLHAGETQFYYSEILNMFDNNVRIANNAFLSFIENRIVSKGSSENGNTLYLIDPELRSLFLSDNSDDSIYKRLIPVLYSFLKSGKTTFFRTDLPDNLSLSYQQIKDSLAHLRKAGFITPCGKVGNYSEYHINLMEYESDNSTGEPASLLLLLQNLAEKDDTNRSKVAGLILDSIKKGKTELSYSHFLDLFDNNKRAATNSLVPFRENKILIRISKATNNPVYAINPELTGEKNGSVSFPFQIFNSLFTALAKQGSVRSQIAQLILEKVRNGSFAIFTGEIQAPQTTTYYTMSEFVSDGILMQPASVGYYKINQKLAIICEYSKSILTILHDLASSPFSTKDRRIGKTLIAGLDKGLVECHTESEESDMQFAMQLGLVDKMSDHEYIILQDLGERYLYPDQKIAATAMYESFGDEAFSLDMVIASLAYDNHQASACLHQFTLLKILDRKENKTFQFKVTPEDHPEYFVA